MANKILAQLLELPIPEDQTRASLRFLGDELNSTDIGTEKFKKIKLKLIDLGIPEDIPDKYFGIVVENWYENFTEAPEYVAQDQTVISEKTNEATFEELEKRQTSEKEAWTNAKQEVDRARQKLEEIKLDKDKKYYAKVEAEKVKLNEDQEKKFNNYKEFLKGQTKEELTHEVEVIQTEIKNRVGSDLISKGLSDQQVEVVTKGAATEFVENVVLMDSPNYVPPTHQTAVLAHVANDPQKFGTVVSESANNVATTEILKKDIYEATIRAAFPDLADKILGTTPENVYVSENPQPGYTQTFSTYQLNQGNKDILDNQSQGLTMIKDLSKDQIQKIALDKTGEIISKRIALLQPQSTAARLLASPEARSMLFTTFGIGSPIEWGATTKLGQLALQISPESGAYLSTFSQLSGVGLGIYAANVASAGVVTVGEATIGGVMSYEAGTIAGASMYGGTTTTFFVSEAGAQVTSQVTGQVAAKTGLAGLISGIAKFLGIGLGWATFGLSTLAGILVGEIAKKIDWTKVKEWLRKNGWILGLGAVAINPWLGIGIAAAMYGLTRQIRLAAIGAGIWGFFGAIGSAFVISISTPIIVTLLVLPPLVAFIMLVINTGAYLVPPDLKSLGINIDNPYILVTKIASPDTIGNFSGVTKVTYTVTITALKDPLTNLSITDKKCTVSKKDVSTVTPCPNGLEDIPDLPNDLTVSPASPYSFTFDVEYDSKYLDSLIFDSITIKADAGEKKGITTTGSESVCIGDCPHGCFVLSDNSESWPSNYKSTLEGATQKLTSEFPDFVEKACSERAEINLCYTTSDPSPVGTGGLCNGAIYGFHSHSQECDILFNQCGLSNDSDALFLLTHELSHHVQKFDGDMINRYENFGADDELPLCSYSGTNGSLEEGSAEANALYANGGTASFSTCSMNFRSQYPNNYNFANDYMNNP